jgi:hypothetical protein
MTYVLKPPTVQEGPAGLPPLFNRYTLTKADSLIMTAGVVTRQRTFSNTQTNAADFVYLGGHEYILSPIEYTQLVAAGYGSYITTLP